MIPSSGSVWISWGRGAGDAFLRPPRGVGTGDAGGESPCCSGATYGTMARSPPSPEESGTCFTSRRQPTSSPCSRRTWLALPGEVGTGCGPGLFSRDGTRGCGPGLCSRDRTRGCGPGLFSRELSRVARIRASSSSFAAAATGSAGGGPPKEPVGTLGGVPAPLLVGVEGRLRCLRGRGPGCLRRGMPRPAAGAPTGGPRGEAASAALKVRAPEAASSLVGHSLSSAAGRGGATATNPVAAATVVWRLAWKAWKV